jgi:hypothetical protein
MQEAKSVTQEMVRWCRSTPQPTLTEMEDKVLALQQRLGKWMLQVVLEAQAARHPAPGPLCAKCRQEMRYKGEKERWLGSRVGGVQLRLTLSNWPNKGTILLLPNKGCSRHCSAIAHQRG